jgi:hypothetical protein
MAHLKHPWGSFNSTRRPFEKLVLHTGLPARLGALDANYTVVRSNPLNLLSVTGVTQTTGWNGAQTTTQGAAGAITTTTPGGRTISTTTDAQGLPTLISLRSMREGSLRKAG